MALAATRITLKYAKLPELEHVRFSESVEDSMAINQVKAGAAIISASGMCEGGRIKHHLRHNLSRPECAIVFVGFQAAGTLGRRIVDGAPRVRIFGEEYPVRARVFTIGGLSAHADQSALLGWLAGFRKAPRQTWVVHGEPLAANALHDAIDKQLRWRANLPAPGQTIDLAA
jgi:metallo-beta-lactamase family protein